MINEFIFRTKEFVCIFVSFCDVVFVSTILPVHVIMCFRGVVSSEENDKEANSWVCAYTLTRLHARIETVCNIWTFFLSFYWRIDRRYRYRTVGLRFGYWQVVVNLYCHITRTVHHSSSATKGDFVIYPWRSEGAPKYRCKAQKHTKNKTSNYCTLHNSVSIWDTF